MRILLIVIFALVVSAAAAQTPPSDSELRAYRGLKIELHISNPHLREKFRHTSYVAPAVDAVVAGLGVGGYELVIRLLAKMLEVNSR